MCHRHPQEMTPPRMIYRVFTRMDGHHLRNAVRFRVQSFVRVPMTENRSYVEKEIQDEIDKGRADKYEVCQARLKIGQEIGGGEFGTVFLGTTNAGNEYLADITTIAVKQLKSKATSEEKDDFLKEIDIMKRLGQHPNIVRLLGCCTIKEPLCMLMEYVPCGDLKHYLQALRKKYDRRAFVFNDVTTNICSQNRLSALTAVANRQDQQHKLSESSYILPDTPKSDRPSITETEYTLLSSEGVPLTPNTPHTPQSPEKLECVLDSKELQSFAVQIARGMKYLEEKQIIHRDLAARNILIDEKRSLKISDFGFSRIGVYTNTKKKRLPWRWMSIEAMINNQYSNKSDVWSYGIVLWEIGTLGAFPYLAIDNQNILNYLLEGNRLGKPENCTEELYKLMLECWSYREDERPSFNEIVDYLEKLTINRRAYVDFSQLNPSYIFPPTEEQISRTESLCNLESVKTIEMVSEDNCTNLSQHGK